MPLFVNFSNVCVQSLSCQTIVFHWKMVSKEGVCFAPSSRKPSTRLLANSSGQISSPVPCTTHVGTWPPE